MISRTRVAHAFAAAVMAAAAVLQELYPSSDEDTDGAGILSLADDPAFSGPAVC